MNNLLAAIAYLAGRKNVSTALYVHPNEGAAADVITAVQAASRTAAGVGTK